MLKLEYLIINFFINRDLLELHKRIYIYTESKLIYFYTTLKDDWNLERSEFLS